MRKRIKKVPVVMHQHIDEQGRIFGARHPIDSVHKNKKTQKKHEYTLENR